MPEFPPTIIVVHPKERRSKCTAEPLRGREGFLFWTYPHVDPDALAAPGFPPLAKGGQGGGGYVRLGLGGSELSADDADRGLLVLDGTWRYAGIMERDFSHLPVRTLPPWKTAYPRQSKLFEDPSEGLATIEAIFAAYTILGRDATGLLDRYPWADEFLELNHDRLP